MSVSYAHLMNPKPDEQGPTNFHICSSFLSRLNIGYNIFRVLSQEMLLKENQTQLNSYLQIKALS